MNAATNGARILGAVEDYALHDGGTIRAGMPRQQRRVTQGFAGADIRSLGSL
jgi:hypothetical protein